MFYSVAGIVFPVGELYNGEMQAGDREATQEEIDAYNNNPIKIEAQKWAQVYSEWDVLTVTVASGNKFAANEKALNNMAMKTYNTDATAAITWIEDWATFNTTVVEIKEALNLAETARQTIVNTVFGV